LGGNVRKRRALRQRGGSLGSLLWKSCTLRDSGIGSLGGTRAGRSGGILRGSGIGSLGGTRAGRSGGILRGSG
jgi:hypothetical protein